MYAHHIANSNYISSKALSRSLGVFLAFAACGLSSCFLFENSQTDKSNQLIIKDSIVFDRLASGDRARISFQTHSTAFCELKVWSSDTPKTDIEATATIKSCFNTAAGQKDFIETVNGLKTNALYTIQISAWSVTSNKDSSDRVIVRENEGKDLGKELIVVRLNHPLRNAEIHTHVSSETLNYDRLKSDLKTDLGCHAGVWQSKFSFSEAGALKVSDVSSEGYGASVASTHQDFDDRLRIDFSYFRNESAWFWNYKEHNESFRFQSQQPAEIYAVELTSNKTNLIENSSLTTSLELFPIDSQKPLVFNWSSDNYGELAYVNVQVGTDESTGAFSCLFEASKSTGTVPLESKLLDKLAAGIHNVTVTLYSMQLQLFPSENRLPWLIASYDWRAAKIQKT